MVAWETVQKPKDKGGLGVINLRLHNDALLLKHLDKFYNRRDIAWVKLVWFRYYDSKVPHAAREVGSFWWKDVLRLNFLFRTVTTCLVQDGASICFWEDNWSGCILKDEFPRLASFAKYEGISVSEIMQAEDLDSLFRLPLSQQALLELEELQMQLQQIPYDADEVDIWTPIWSGAYASKQFYSYIYDMLDAHPIFRELWKTSCTPRVKFFIWLIMVDRLNTKSMLKRRNLHIQDDEICVMCDTGEEEDIEHLFFRCPFAIQCWSSINFHWDFSLDLQDRFIAARQVHGLSFFTEAAMLATWEIWKMRNEKVFDRHPPSHGRWLCNFKASGFAQSVRFRVDLRTAFCFWLDAFS